MSREAERLGDAAAGEGVKAAEVNISCDAALRLLL